jgi:imidazole glycerol-phosphate synthase subunit HisF
MMPRRIIPFFLLAGKRLVKGTRFRDHIDVGDPISQAMVFDAQGADEIAIVDIHATAQGRTIDPALITAMIQRCRLPIAAGGGIRSIDDARRCFAAGADKIIVNTRAVLDPPFVRELATEFGSQSVVVSVDVRGNAGDGTVYVQSGSEPVPGTPSSIVEELVAQGAGEVILTSVDREGMLEGFEIPLYRELQERIPVSLIASGGAGSYDQIVALFRETQCDGVAIGKMLALRDYDIVRIKSYLKGRGISVRDA